MFFIRLPAAGHTPLTLSLQFNRENKTHNSRNVLMEAKIFVFVGNVTCVNSGGRVAKKKTLMRSPAELSG